MDPKSQVNENDELEEFPAQAWNARDEDRQDAQLWTSQEADGTLDEEFTRLLKQELAKQQAAKEAAASKKK